MKQRSPLALAFHSLALCAVSAAGALAVPAIAAADFNLSFGLRYEPARYTLPQFATQRTQGMGDPVPGSNGTATIPSYSSSNALQRQDFGATIGIGFTDKLTLTLGVDFARASLNHADSDAQPTTLGFSTFGITAGLKWNFVAPAKEKISPYLRADFFKYFAALNDDRPGALAQDQVEFAAGLASPMGFHLAFGIEYWFTDSFALGAEILGLAGAFSSGSLRDGGGGNPVVTRDQSLNSISIYTAFTMTFRFPNLVKYGAGKRYRYREADERD